MRKFLDIDLNAESVSERELSGEEVVYGGRYLIAKTLVESGAATIDPLSPENPLLFSVGPFAGTNFSNANRTSVGCKSPLTGGVKEANAGGTLGVALGQLHIAGLQLNGAAAGWTLIHIAKSGAVTFEAADEYLGQGTFETAERLHEKYGKKVSLAICGPVGEYQGLLAGISISDTDRRPSRLAARGGVGAVMGSKKVKAIVVEFDKMPKLVERKKVIGAVREYGALLDKDELIADFRTRGTAGMADFTNYIGGLPVRNFTAGRLVDTDQVLHMGGTHIYERTVERGGEPSHACMPGCLIQCSNVYVDEQGKEIASPVEYETLSLLGTNCGLDDPDDLARMNFIVNDLGVDSIETGGTIGVLMDAGIGGFGDTEFMYRVLDDIRKGSNDGRLYAQGAARVADHFKVARAPVIKQQTISAYDPRVIEVTGVTMMTSAQGADHTAGNVPRFDSAGKDVDEIVAVSMDAQVNSAAVDSLGLCIFGRSVTLPHLQLIADAINSAMGTSFTADFFQKIGRDTLRFEEQFNRAAGFVVEDDELPQFFYDEALPPSDKTARFHSAEVRRSMDKWWQQAERPDREQKHSS